MSNQRLQASIDRLAGLVENGHLLASTGGDGLLDAASELIAALRRDLALAQEAWLAAELRAEGLLDKLKYLAAPHPGGCQRRGIAITVVDRDRPASLEPLRELLAAIVNLKTPQDDDKYNRFDRAVDAALAAYPFLDPGAEPAGEVGDGD